MLFPNLVTALLLLGAKGAQQNSPPEATPQTLAPALKSFAVLEYADAKARFSADKFVGTFDRAELVRRAKEAHYEYKPMGRDRAVFLPSPDEARRRIEMTAKAMQIAAEKNGLATRRGKSDPLPSLRLRDLPPDLRLPATVLLSPVNGRLGDDHPLVADADLQMNLSSGGRTLGLTVMLQGDSSTAWDDRFEASVPDCISLTPSEAKKMHDDYGTRAVISDMMTDRFTIRTFNPGGLSWLPVSETSELVSMVGKVLLQRREELARLNSELIGPILAKIGEKDGLYKAAAESNGKAVADLPQSLLRQIYANASSYKAYGFSSEADFRAFLGSATVGSSQLGFGFATSTRNKAGYDRVAFDY